MEFFDLELELLRIRQLASHEQLNARLWYNRKRCEIKEDFNNLDFEVWNNFQYLKDKYTNDSR